MIEETRYLLRQRERGHVCECQTRGLLHLPTHWAGPGKCVVALSFAFKLFVISHRPSFSRIHRAEDASAKPCPPITSKRASKKRGKEKNEETERKGYRTTFVARFSHKSSLNSTTYPFLPLSTLSLSLSITVTLACALILPPTTPL